MGSDEYSDLPDSETNFEWQQIFDSLPDMIAIIGLDFKIKKVNKAMLDTLGVKSEDLVGKECYSLMHHSEEPPALCPHAEMVHDEASHEVEFPIELLKGDYSVSASPIKDKDGNLTGSLHIVHSVTERNELSKINRYLASIVESSADAIYGKDLDGNIISWNKAAESMFGYLREEMIGKSMFALVPTNKEAEYHEFMDRVNHGEAINNHDTQRIKKNGELIDVALYISPMYDSNGNINGSATIAHDIHERKLMERTLKESEEKYREVFNNANDAMFLQKVSKNGPGKFIEVNDTASEGLGYSKEELLNMGLKDIISPDTVSYLPTVFENVIRDGKATFESEHMTKKGELFPVEVNTHQFNIRGEKYILSIARDISERKKAEKALINSEEKYRTIFENVQDVFFQTDNNGKIITLSPSIETFSGYKPEELIGKNVSKYYFDPDDRTKLIHEIQTKGSVEDFELTLETKDKKLKNISFNAHLMKNCQNEPIGIEGTQRDVTERKQMEIKLKNSLKEKEMLLKEIHHRVKNNLMIISSLLSLQTDYIKDKTSKDIFIESQNRARSMALIHEKLYQSTDLKRINFGEYIKNLTSELFYTYRVGNIGVDIHYNIQDLKLDINTAIPLGLIANELITNSLKYAFVDSDEGIINIEFRKVDHNYVFIIKDNGVGLPEGFDFKNTDSLGLQLVNNLSEQIDAEIELNTGEGTEFKIIFKEIEIV
ncbi:MAG: PAS domain S-box protein [Methanobacterium sp.]|nr:PAS domain S-box protein [Methanobacterium sp.]